MLIFWRIRYLDRNDRQFKDRDLFLDTATLPPVTKAAVELAIAAKNNRPQREFLKYRTLFREESHSDGLTERIEAAGGMNSFCLTDYFEDDAGQEITLQEMGPILTGNPTAVLVPSGTKQHDLDYMFAEPKLVPVAEASLSPEEVRVLGYFTRDLQELQESALMKDGPGSIKCGGTLPVLPNGDYHFQTAVTDDEIRSFMTIFRRLYMESEPANLKKAVAVFYKAIGGHSLAKWVEGIAGEYEKHLSDVPEFRPRMQAETPTFTVKRLIDVFLYTQYAHQPDEKRERQFNDCLKQLNGKRNLLTWTFLTEVWKCGLEIGNAGKVIAKWFQIHCDHHGITPDILNSLRHEHLGLGTVEKAENRKTRLFQEKAEELALELWKQNDRPEGGSTQFLLEAREQLTRAMNGDESTLNVRNDFK